MDSTTLCNTKKGEGNDKEATMTRIESSTVVRDGDGDDHCSQRQRRVATLTLRAGVVAGQSRARSRSRPTRRGKAGRVLNRTTETSPRVISCAHCRFEDEVMKRELIHWSSRVGVCPWGTVIPTLRGLANRSRFSDWCSQCRRWRLSRFIFSYSVVVPSTAVTLMTARDGVLHLCVFCRITRSGDGRQK